MSIFETAYDTVACSGYRTQDIEDKLKVARIQGGLYNQTFKLSNFDYAIDLALVQGGTSATDVVPYFSHPYCFRDTKDGALTLFVDVRNYGKWDTQQSRFTVRNQIEYDWHVMRAVLNYLWLSERPELFRDMSTLPASVYGTLISQTVARKYALDPGEQTIILGVSTFFYYCLFTEEREWDETTHAKIVGKVAQITRIPADKLMTLLEGVKPIHGLEALCEVIREKTGSVRLNDFNIGVLLAIVSGNWFGSNAREILATGLEHIPTWLMICYSAISEATFKRSMLAKLAEQFAKGGAGDAFERSMESLIDKKNLFSSHLTQ